MTFPLARLFVVVALLIAFVNIFTSLIHLETPDAGVIRRSDVVFPVAHKRNNTLSPLDYLDCNRNESSCSYFYPSEFYDNSSSLGYRHRHDARQQVYGTSNRTVDANWARFQFNSPQQQQDWTYIHVRKAGGNTIYEFARQVQTNFSKVEIMPSVPVHRLVQRIGEEEFIKRMKILVKQTEFFTFVRNPISRFVSAMGQVYDKKRHVLEGVGCSYPNSSPTDEMACALKLLRNGHVVNSHLIPASIELYQMTSFYPKLNKRVAVFPLEAMNEFMGMWNVSPLKRNEAIGNKSRYSTDQLSRDMIADICKVYEADVQMMRMLNMPVEECDAFIPVSVIERK